MNAEMRFHWIMDHPYKAVGLMQAALREAMNSDDYKMTVIKKIDEEIAKDVVRRVR